MYIYNQWILHGRSSEKRDFLPLYAFVLSLERNWYSGKSTGLGVLDSNPSSATLWKYLLLSEIQFPHMQMEIMFCSEICFENYFNWLIWNAYYNSWSKLDAHLTIPSFSSQGDGSNNWSGQALIFCIYELCVSAGRDLEESVLLISV